TDAPDMQNPRRTPPEHWTANPGSGLPAADGTLAIERNCGAAADPRCKGNGNNWVNVALVGTKGYGGAVNRDGIGATVRFTPQHGKPSMLPVLGGSSSLSQNSLVLGFGLGPARRGTLEGVWPNGVKNRRYHVDRA